MLVDNNNIRVARSSTVLANILCIVGFTLIIYVVVILSSGDDMVWDITCAEVVELSEQCEEPLRCLAFRMCERRTFIQSNVMGYLLSQCSNRSHCFDLSFPLRRETINRSNGIGWSWEQTNWVVVGVNGLWIK